MSFENLKIILDDCINDMDEIFKDDAGELYRFSGILIASDDYYYLMHPLNKENKAKWLSCVGNLETHGFEKVVK